MKIKILFILLVISALKINSFAQEINDAKANYNFKLSTYVLGYGGFGISGSFGSWFTYGNIQSSINISSSLIINRFSFGNKNRFKSNFQWNTLISPMFTFGKNSSSGYYEELHPFYFGSTNSVYSNFPYHLTIGTNFIISPRGSRNTLSTFKNRTQQLLYLGVRIGGTVDSAKKTYSPSFQLNLYEDYFIFTDWVGFRTLSDNYDRFYTGGGNAQFRFNKNNKLKLYSEVYTGNFQKENFDHADLYLPNKKLKEGKKNERASRYVSQEAGQKMFNIGRTFFELEHRISNNNLENTTISGIIGLQGGMFNMWSQNMIHNWDGINKVNQKKIEKWKSQNGSTNPPKKYKGWNGKSDFEIRSSKKAKETLHHFYPAYDYPGLIFGSKINYKSFIDIK